MAGRPETTKHGDYDPLILDVMNKLGPSVFTRQLARVHEGPKYFKWVMNWLKQVDLHDRFYIKPVEHESGKGFGSTEAARGSLSDWIVIENGKIENYQVVTPTAWNIGPKDGKGTHGPIEKRLSERRLLTWKTRLNSVTSPAVSTRVWSAPFTPTTAKRAKNFHVSKWAECSLIFDF